MTRRVLVVDDDRQMVRTLRDILALHGWDTDGAHSGEEAVAAVRAGDYAVVLMDVRMSGMSGVEALRAMRAERPGIQVILMTAYTASDLLAEAEREGALRILPKPVELRQLMAVLDTLLHDARCVLVVDDDPAFLRTTAALLRARRFEVLEARSLDQALATLEREAPGAVVLDLRLDHVEPRDCVLAIKRVSPAVALILYSGHPTTLDRTAASVPASWIRGTLQKPFAPDRLTALLDDIFRD
ncbi:MAG TPA: response regulator [Gemmatimonadaceae bacterium]